MTETVMVRFTHKRREWKIVQKEAAGSSAYFARDDKGADTGPFALVKSAKSWIKTQ